MINRTENIYPDYICCFYNRLLGLMTLVYRTDPRMDAFECSRLAARVGSNRQRKRRTAHEYRPRGRSDWWRHILGGWWWRHSDVVWLGDGNAVHGSVVEWTWRRLHSSSWSTAAAIVAVICHLTIHSVIYTRTMTSVILSCKGSTPLLLGLNNVWSVFWVFVNSSTLLSDGKAHAGGPSVPYIPTVLFRSKWGKNWGDQLWWCWNMCIVRRKTLVLISPCRNVS